MRSVAIYEVTAHARRSWIASPWHERQASPKTRQGLAAAAQVQMRAAGFASEVVDLDGEGLAEVPFAGHSVAERALRELTGAGGAQ